MYDSIIIVGATATGKTSVSIELAKKLNAEIVNADSMYIYNDLNIGTAKPTKEEMQGIKHHLISIAESTDDFNVVDFRTKTKDVINTLKQNNTLPIVVGGTGFYVDSLIKNYSYGNTSNSSKIRTELFDILEKKGKDYLYNLLLEKDSATASRLHKNDVVRVIRALEICMSTNNTVSLENNEEPILKNPLIIGLTMPRDLLYDKINRRVDIMINSGLIDEVKSLIDRGLTPNNSQSMKGIGYKEIYEYLENNYSLDEAIEKIKQHTRNYAKRQITWFKRNDKITWFDTTTNKCEIISNIINLYNKNTQ